MKKYWTKIAIALGPAIIAASVVWVYATTNKEYNFLVTPWSLRGYETDHGIVFLVLAALLLIGGMATAWEGTLKNAVSSAIAAYFVIAATLFAFVFAEDDITVSVTSVMNIVFSLFIATATALALRSLLGDRVKLFKRALPTAIVVFVVMFGLASIAVVGSEITAPVWIFVFIVFLLFAGLSAAIRPINMAANRMLVTSAVAGWGVITMSAGAIRQHLLDTQLTTIQTNGAVGISAQYKDTQAALGWWLAGLGAFVLFIGAVGLWAKRRDIVSALARARKQREAAEKSAREIQEAADAYANELSASQGTASGAASPPS